MEVNRNWPDPYVNLAALYANRGEVDKSIKLLKDGIEKTKGNLTLQLSLANYYTIQKRFDDAKSEYQSVLKYMPANTMALNNLASILLDHSDGKDHSAEALAYALKLQPTQNMAHIDTLAWAYAKTGNYQKAVDLLRPVLETMPKALVFQYHFGYALYHNENKDEAKPYLEHVAGGKKTLAGVIDANKLLATYNK